MNNSTEMILVINDLMTYRENAGNIANLTEWLTSETDEHIRQAYQTDIDELTVENASLVTRYAAKGLNISYDAKAHNASLSPNICVTCDEVVGLEDDHTHQ